MIVCVKPVFPIQTGGQMLLTICKFQFSLIIVLKTNPKFKHSLAFI